MTIRRLRWPPWRKPSPGEVLIEALGSLRDMLKAEGVDPPPPPPELAELAELVKRMKAGTVRMNGPMIITRAGREAIEKAQGQTTVDMLRSWAASYGSCPFKAGDLVTPRKGAGMHGEGDPHVVLEALAEPVFFQSHEDASAYSASTWGARVDVRVLHVNDSGHVHAHWGESWLYEPWAPSEPFEIPHPSGEVARTLREAMAHGSSDQLRARVIEVLREAPPAPVGWSAFEISRKIPGSKMEEVRDALGWAINHGAARMEKTHRKRMPRYFPISGEGENDEVAFSTIAAEPLGLTAAVIAERAGLSLEEAISAMDRLQHAGRVRSMLGPDKGNGVPRWIYLTTEHAPAKEEANGQA